MTTATETTTRRPARADRNDLVTQWMPFAYRLAALRARRQGLTKSHPDWEDCCQQAVLGLVYARDRFDPELGYAFPTYAAYWINYRLQRWERSVAKARRLTQPAEDALESVPDGSGPRAALLSDELEAAVAGLPRGERLIVRRRYLSDSGRKATLREVGDELGLCAERVRQIEAQALARLRGALGDGAPRHPRVGPAGAA